MTGQRASIATAPYDKLRRALRTEVDEAAWSALFRIVTTGVAGHDDPDRLALEVRANRNAVALIARRASG